MLEAFNEMLEQHQVVALLTDPSLSPWEEEHPDDPETPGICLKMTTTL
jgi:hypothetical protein